MTLSNLTITEKLIELGNNYVTLFEQTHGFLPVCEKDEQWLSPCELSAYDEEHNFWQPIKIDESLVFDNVEKALEFSLHASIKEYFSAMYSESISAHCEEGSLALIFAWNKDDFSRLQENIIGHILMKKRLKQNTTIFFAVTDDDDYILSLNNETGEIWVERVGCEPHKKIADNMLTFLNSLSIEVPAGESK